MDPAQCAGSFAFKGTLRTALSVRTSRHSPPEPRPQPSALSEGFPSSHLNDCRRAIFFSAIRQRGDVSTPWARSDTGRTGADRTGAGHTDRARTDKGGSVSGSWPNPTPRQRRSHLPVHICVFGICVFGCHDLPHKKTAASVEAAVSGLTWWAPGPHPPAVGGLTRLSSPRWRS